MTTRDAPTEASDQTAHPPARRRFWPRFELSATQLVATALAAITATIAASYLGVSGTVIGAALASVVSAVGNAVYGHSLRSTRDRVREVVPVPRFSPRAARPPRPGAASGRVDDAAAEAPPVLPAPEHRRPRSTRTRWRGVAVGSVSLFVALLAVVTGVEMVAGRPLSDLVRGDGGAGTSVFGDTGQTGAGSGSSAVTTTPTQTADPTPTQTVTETVTPSVVVTTPTVTQTAPAVTRTATPTVSASPSIPSGSATSASPSDASTSPSAAPRS